jgi:phosphate transport system permease protein
MRGAVALRLDGHGVAILLAFAGAAFALTRVSASLQGAHPGRARVMVLLLVASLIAILTTVGIFLSLLWESLRFFSKCRSPTSCSARTGARR